MIVLGLFAHWFINKQNQEPIVGEVETGQVETESEDKTEADQASVEIPATSGGSAAEAEVLTEDNIDSDLQALDSLLEENYDDSNLDNLFDESGANYLTENYDI